jgi:uncharacterized membrane protein YbhN (UPF0104 family)
MRSWLKKSWPWLKAVFAVAILAFIGRRFVQDLRNEELWNHSLRFEWVALSAILYLAGLGCLAVYWYRLLAGLDQHPSFLGAIRAHYTGQMGKYLPGKAWALVLRAGMVRAPRLRVGVAVMTSFYEVLTTMASGVLLAFLWFAVHVRSISPVRDWHAFLHLFRLPEATTEPPHAAAAALLALFLFLVIGIPVLPPIFNRLAGRIAQPFRGTDSAPLPRVPLTFLFQGLFFALGSWLFLGTSLWAMLQAVMAHPPAWSLSTWGHQTAYVALAYVAGFIIIFVPSGLGVRESLLVLFLAPEIAAYSGGEEASARATAALAVLVLRLVWTAAELVMVAVLYWLPVSKET